MAHKHTEETKKKISEIRKQWFIDNPDKNPWKRSNRHISPPCEKLKNKLVENNISFISEFRVDPTRGFSIDIAFPDKKIGIEVNGGQHYNPDKTLKPYYEERKKHIESLGWKIYDVHYSLAYKEKFLNEFVLTIKNENDLGSVDYSFYIPKPKEKPKCVDCKTELKWGGKRCNSCYNTYKKTTNKTKKYVVTKEELEKLILTKSFCEIGRIFKVTDNAIKKRAIALGIDITISPFNHKTIRKLKDQQPKKTRNPSVDEDKIIKLYCEGYTIKQIEQECNCSNTPILRVINYFINHYPV